jgi:hypothetical protein
MSHNQTQQFTLETVDDPSEEVEVTNIAPTRLEDNFFKDAGGFNAYTELPEKVGQWIKSDLEQARVTSERLNRAQQANLKDEIQSINQQYDSFNEKLEQRTKSQGALNLANTELTNAQNSKSQLEQQLTSKGLIGAITPDLSRIPPIKTEYRTNNERVPGKLLKQNVPYSHIGATTINNRRESFVHAMREGLELEGIQLDEESVQNLRNKTNEIARHVEATLSNFPNAYDHHTIQDPREIANAPHPLTEKAALLLKAQLITEDIITKGVNPTIDDTNNLYPGFEEPLIPIFTVESSQAEQKAESQVSYETELLTQVQTAIDKSIDQVGIPSSEDQTPEYQLKQLLVDQIRWAEAELENVQATSVDQLAIQTVLQKYPELNGVDLQDKKAMQNATEVISKRMIRDHFQNRINQLSTPSNVSKAIEQTNAPAMQLEGLDSTKDFMKTQITPENIAHLERLMSTADATPTNVDQRITSQGMQIFDNLEATVRENPADKLNTNPITDLRRIVNIIANDKSLPEADRNQAKLTVLALFTATYIDFTLRTGSLYSNERTSMARTMRANLMAARQYFDIDIDSLGIYSSAFKNLN